MDSRPHAWRRQDGSEENAKLADYLLGPRRVQDDAEPHTQQPRQARFALLGSRGWFPGSRSRPPAAQQQPVYV
jgi:hypothetical protein